MKSDTALNELITALGLSVGWTESYEDFSAYLQHIGVRLSPRPNFRPGDAVTVACRPGVIAIRKGQQSDLERTQELERTNTRELRAEPLVGWQFYVLAKWTKRGLVFRFRDPKNEPG